MLEEMVQCGGRHAEGTCGSKRSGLAVQADRRRSLAWGGRRVGWDHEGIPVWSWSAMPFIFRCAVFLLRLPSLKPSWSLVPST